MKPPFPSYTSEWHDDTYESIDPTKRPELSVAGKRVIISGGGAGIGRGVTQAFADAGAASIAIFGRREPLLEETKRLITSKNSKIAISTFVADVTDRNAVNKIAQAIGPWDIFVANVGYMPKASSIADTDPREWWKGYEVNVQGNFNLMQAFLPTRGTGAVVISMNAGSIQVPGPFGKTHSSYNSSKFAMLKFFEVLAEENPDLHVVSMHPGVVETDMSTDNGIEISNFDTMELPSHFAVWLCSDEAKFLRGRFVWSNWDVPQLLAKREEIENSLLFTANAIGWPFQ